MEKTRKILGLVSLIIGVSAILILSEIAPVFSTSHKVDQLGSILVGIWLLLSVLNKTSMISSQKAFPVNKLAVLIFFILLAYVFIFPTPENFQVYTWKENVLYTILVLGWLITDCVDIVLQRISARKLKAEFVH